MTKVDLSKYKNTGNVGVKDIAWQVVRVCLFSNRLNPFSFIKVFLLRLFGAKVGEGVVIKTAVNIKRPWFLEIGDNVWIGEEVWIDNIVSVSVGSNSCISQGAMIFTGNHDYKKESFDLMVKPVVIEDGVWIGAKAIVCPGVKVFSHSVLTAGSVAVGDMLAYQIYQGNPAVFKRDREIA